jgi:hypothetical protein
MCWVVQGVKSALAQSRIPQKIDGGMVKPTMKHLEKKGYKSTLEDEKRLSLE